MVNGLSGKNGRNARTRIPSVVMTPRSDTENVNHQNQLMVVVIVLAMILSVLLVQRKKVCYYASFFNQVYD